MPVPFQSQVIREQPDTRIGLGGLFLQSLAQTLPGVVRDLISPDPQSELARAQAGMFEDKRKQAGLEQIQKIEAAFRGGQLRREEADAQIAYWAGGMGIDPAQVSLLSAPDARTALQARQESAVIEGANEGAYDPNQPAPTLFRSPIQGVSSEYSETSEGSSPGVGAGGAVASEGGEDPASENVLFQGANAEVGAASGQELAAGLIPGPVDPGLSRAFAQQHRASIVQAMPPPDPNMSPEQNLARFAPVPGARPSRPIATRTPDQADVRDLQARAMRLTAALNIIDQTRAGQVPDPQAFAMLGSYKDQAEELIQAAQEKLGIMDPDVRAVLNWKNITDMSILQRYNNPALASTVDPLQAQAIMQRFEAMDIGEDPEAWIALSTMAGKIFPTPADPAGLMNAVTNAEQVKNTYDLENKRIGLFGQQIDMQRRMNDAQIEDLGVKGLLTRQQIETVKAERDLIPMRIQAAKAELTQMENQQMIQFAGLQKDMLALQIGVESTKHQQFLEVLKAEGVIMAGQEEGLWRRAGVFLTSADKANDAAKAYLAQAAMPGLEEKEKKFYTEQATTAATNARLAEKAAAAVLNGTPTTDPATGEAVAPPVDYAGLLGRLRHFRDTRPDLAREFASEFAYLNSFGMKNGRIVVTTPPLNGRQQQAIQQLAEHDALVGSSRDYMGFLQVNGGGQSMDKFLGGNRETAYQLYQQAFTRARKRTAASVSGAAGGGAQPITPRDPVQVVPAQIAPER